MLSFLKSVPLLRKIKVTSLSLALNQTFIDTIVIPQSFQNLNDKINNLSEKIEAIVVSNNSSDDENENDGANGHNYGGAGSSRVNGTKGTNSSVKSVSNMNGGNNVGATSGANIGATLGAANGSTVVISNVQPGLSPDEYAYVEVIVGCCQLLLL